MPRSGKYKLNTQWKARFFGLPDSWHGNFQPSAPIGRLNLEKYGKNVLIVPIMQIQNKDNVQNKSGRLLLSLIPNYPFLVTRTGGNHPIYCILIETNKKLIQICENHVEDEVNAVFIILCLGKREVAPWPKFIVNTAKTL